LSGIVEYFQIFSNVSPNFSNIFERFTQLFERFQSFLNGFFLPILPKPYKLTHLTLDFDPKTPKKPQFFPNHDNFNRQFFPAFAAEIPSAGQTPRI